MAVKACLEESSKDQEKLSSLDSGDWPGKKGAPGRGNSFVHKEPWFWPV